MIPPNDEQQHEASLPWTGERFVPSINGSIYYEHLHRYAFALELVADRTCLDLACGEGFGSSLLARKAKFVWGVDADESCIRHANRKYVKSNLKFLTGTAAKIPLEDNSIDVVVSFETIEHFGEHDAFLREITRVLRPDGLLVISSPDKKEYADKTGHQNSYHIAELYHSEFSELLKRYFSQVKLGRQRLVAGSYILPDETDGKDPASWGIFTGNLTGTQFDEGIPDGTYSIAMCSNRALPKIKYGLFEDLAFLRGTDAIQARVNAGDEAIRRDQQLAELVAAREKAQSEASQLMMERDQALRVHEQVKAYWEQKSAEQQAGAETAQNRINQLMIEKERARHEHELAKAAWELQLTGQRAAVATAQNRINELMTEKDQALQDYQQAKASLEQQLAELKAVTERDQGQIAQLLRDKDDMQRKVDASAPGQKRPWFRSTVQLWGKSRKIEKEESEANLIAASGLFDESFYGRVYPDVVAAKMNLLEHYVNHGRREGRVPSENFDPGAYLEANPDLVPHGVDPILHYIRHGKREGRPVVSKVDMETAEILRRYKARKPTVVVVSHDGSRTGAPILVYNLTVNLLKQFEVIVLFLGPGPMLDACRHAGAVVLGPIRVWENSPRAARVASLLVKYAQPRFAIVNSVEARHMGIALSRAGVTTLSLLHEFAAYTRPRGAFCEVARNSDATIFSSTLTLDNAVDYHPELRDSPFQVIPQGKTVRPNLSNGAPQGRAVHEPGRLESVRPPNFPDGGVVILGLGMVQLRKGVDLFVECAARVMRLDPQVPVRFVWAGSGFNTETDQYSVFLADQIHRAGLEEIVHFIGEVHDVESAYASSDLVLLTSRLDPLPNSVIDGFAQGVPVVCFDKTTGLVDCLRNYGLEKHCIAGYLDAEDMAEKVVALIRSKKLREELGQISLRIADEVFSMSHYVDKLIDLGEQHILRRRETEEDAEFILSTNKLRPDFVLHLNHNMHLSPLEMAKHYVTGWKRNIYPRKPFPGFHPGIYRELQGLAQGGTDPLAHYLRAGEPEGVWRLPVILPSTEIPARANQRVALHLHAYYPDVVPLILDGINRNESKFDLLVSVTSEKNRKEVLRLLESYTRGSIDVRIVPNVGRDLGPFLSCFSGIIRDNYEFVGHIHTKKSIHIDPRAGKEWIHFLLENLLGSQAPMADLILQAMNQDEQIGMVFPDDPNVLSWGKNRSYAEDLRARLKLPALRDQINFPIGTMFWSRVSTLEALFNLKLSWEDYPAEPLPNDGSILHAIERLLPLIVSASGRSIAVTNVPGVTR